MSEDDRSQTRSVDGSTLEEPRSSPDDGRGLGRRIGGHLDGFLATLEEATPWGDAVTASVLVVTAIALLARLYTLGRRVMHWDEVRVAYWILRWTRTGQFSYRPVIHGPLVQHVNHWTYAVLGTSNAVSRLAVALVGALLPLAALLFREHLDDRETVGVAIALALNPLMLYYSRFMRSDVLVAAFMFVSLGFVVRLIDTHRPRHLYVATAFGALGFASKENAVIYPICWLGMVAAVGGLELLYPRRFASRRAFLAAIRRRSRALVVARAVVRAVEGVVEGIRELLSPRQDDSPSRLPAEAGRRRLAWPGGLTAGHGWRWTGHLVGSAGLFGALTLFFYAPRGTPDGIWTGNVGGTIEASIAAVASGFDRWGDTGIADCFTARENPIYDQFGPNARFAREGPVFDYVCNLGREFGFLVEGASVLAALAVIGVVGAWWGDDPGVLVPGAFMWGVASLLGYAAGTDIIFPPWLTVHAVIALAIPAGAGLALLVRWTRDALADEDVVGAVVAGGLVVLLVTAMAADAGHHAYARPYGTSEPTSIVQFAQPGGELEPALDAMQRTVPAHDGVDVLAYGDDVVDMREGGTFEHPACVKWLSPLSAVSWTLYRTRATVTCVDQERNLGPTLDRANPPIVISSVAQADAVRARLGDTYVSGTYRMYRSDNPERTVVIFFDTAQVEDPPRSA